MNSEIKSFTSTENKEVKSFKSLIDWCNKDKINRAIWYLDNIVPHHVNCRCFTRLIPGDQDIIEYLNGLPKKFGKNEGGVK